MARTHAYRIVVAAALVAATVGTAHPALSATAPTRIMFLGDSITGSPGCWRALLWNRLQAGGFTNIDSVGTQPAQGCSVPYDGDNEGHGGALATSVADQSQLVGWLSASKPDIVVMHFGTNDVWSNKSNSVILAAFSTLVDQMRASKPTMQILVAKIIPMNPPTCPECAARVVAFNAAIPAWATGKSTAASPIVVVDQWTGFNDATDTVDGVHPNDAGNLKISNRWYPALAAALSGSTPTPTPSATPTPTPSATPTPTASPTRSSTPSASPTSAMPTSASPSGSAGCAAAYTMVNQWVGGFQGQVTVTNTGPATIAAWTARFAFANGQQITQYWNAGVTQAGADVTAKPVAWNSSLAAGGSATFGFLATWNGVNGAPAATCTTS